MDIGPVQAVVLGFPPEAKFTGEVMAELDRLQGRGVIRVLDLLFVHKETDGDLVVAEARDEDADLGAIIGALLGFDFEEGSSTGEGDTAYDLGGDHATRGMSVEDLRGVAEQLEPGTSAGVLLIEHAWARQLRKAVRGAGGVPVAQGFLTPEALLLVGAELGAMVEAIEVIERLHATKLHDEVEASRSEQDSYSLGALSALDVLVRDGVLEPGAVSDAITSLVDAQLVDERRAHKLQESTQAALASA
jgi:uncharacterized membrane protein